MDLGIEHVREMALEIWVLRRENAGLYAEIEHHREGTPADLEASAGPTPSPTDVEVIDGRFAYASYASPSGAGDTTWDGRPMPTWDEMEDRQRAGWIAVGRAFAARG